MLSLSFVLCCGFKSNLKVAGYSFNIHDTIAPIGISCQLGCYCNFKGSLLSKTIGNFFPSATHIARFSTVHRSHQRGFYVISTNLILPCPVANEWPSAIESYCQFLVDLEQELQPVLFCRSLLYLWSTTLGEGIPQLSLSWLRTHGIRKKCYCSI